MKLKGGIDMPWCPICKNEYQEGILVCADCNAELVDELPAEDDRVALAYISDEALAGKLVEYLGYNSIDADSEYDEQEASFCVRVPSDRLEPAKSAFRAFYRVESANIANEELKKKLYELTHKNDPDSDDSEEDISDELENISLEDLSDSEKELLSQALVSERVYKPAEVYVTKSDVSKDMFSTAITFLVFAALLMVFLVLNALDIITLFNNTASLIVIGVLSLSCCLVGINAIKRSRKAEIESYSEEQLTDSINKWLDENVTDDMFDELDTADMSEEVRYLRRTEIIKQKLDETYPNLNDDYVDALLDDFYDTRFSASTNEEAESESNDSDDTESENNGSEDTETEDNGSEDTETDE